MSEWVALLATEKLATVNPCEGCPFAGGVEQLDASNVQVTDTYDPGNKLVADVAVQFGEGDQLTGEATVRGVGEDRAHQQVAVITEVTERIGKCAAENGAPLEGRIPGLISDLLLRKQGVRCGAFYAKEAGDRLYPRAIINVTDARKAA